MSDEDKQCNCVTSRTFGLGHRASKCAFGFGVKAKPNTTKPSKPPPPAKTVEATIDKIVADAYAPIKSLFGTPTTSDLAKKGSAEQAKKNKNNSPAPSPRSPPVSPSGTGELSPTPSLSTQSAITELVAVDVTKTHDSAEDSLEPTMPSLPSMSTPGVYIPALHGIQVPASFVTIDAEWSVATAGVVIDGQQPAPTRTQCDATHATCADTVVAEAEMDMVSTHEQSAQHTVVTVPAEQPAAEPVSFEELLAVLLGEQGENPNTDESGSEKSDSDGEGSGSGEGGGSGGKKSTDDEYSDEVSELGYTYFGDSHPAQAVYEPNSVMLAEENQRLTAELFLLKSRQTVPVVCARQDEQYLNTKAAHTADDPGSVTYI